MGFYALVVQGGGGGPPPVISTILSKQGRGLHVRTALKLSPTRVNLFPGHRNKNFHSDESAGDAGMRLLGSFVERLILLPGDVQRVPQVVVTDC